MPAAAIRPVSIKVDEAMKARLNRLAEARQRTPHWMMREAQLDTWLDDIFEATSVNDLLGDDSERQ